MRILFINIALRPPTSRKFLPIGLGYIVSAVKRAGFEFDILDLDAHPQPPEQTEQFLRTHHYDVVAMGCIVTGYKFVKWLSRVIKESFPDTMIIVGNSVASSIPHVLLTKTGADIAVIGEGDVTIVELLEALRDQRDFRQVAGIAYRDQGEVRFSSRRLVIQDINQIPIPDWDLFDIQVYIKSQNEAVDEPFPPMPWEQIRSFVINTARGCIYNCSFCFHVFWGTKYRWRSPEAIINEICYYQEKYGINHIYFHDELSFFSVKQAEAFADAMLASGLKIYWTASCRSGLFTEDEHVNIVKKLKQAGALSLSFSLESANPEILGWMKKKVGPDAFTRQVNICRGGGVAVNTSIVIGYPNETKETIKATMDCCIKNKVYPSVGYLLPQPATPMYNYAIEKGYIKDEEAYLMSMGDRQDLRLNMTKIPNDELENIVEQELKTCSWSLGIHLEPRIFNQDWLLSYLGKTK